MARTFLLGELVQQARLADTHVADDDVLEDVVEIEPCSGHGGTKQHCRGLCNQVSNASRASKRPPLV
jgi:hypothetical protein